MINSFKKDHNRDIQKIQKDKNILQQLRKKFVSKQPLTDPNNNSRRFSRQSSIAILNSQNNSIMSSQTQPQNLQQNQKFSHKQYQQFQLLKKNKSQKLHLNNNHNNANLEFNLNNLILNEQASQAFNTLQKEKNNNGFVQDDTTYTKMVNKPTTIERVFYQRFGGSLQNTPKTQFNSTISQEQQKQSQNNQPSQLKLLERKLLGQDKNWKEENKGYYQRDHEIKSVKEFMFFYDQLKQKNTERLKMEKKMFKQKLIKIEQLEMAQHRNLSQNENNNQQQYLDQEFKNYNYYAQNIENNKNDKNIEFLDNQNNVINDYDDNDDIDDQENNNNLSQNSQIQLDTLQENFKQQNDISHSENQDQYNIVWQSNNANKYNMSQILNNQSTPMSSRPTSGLRTVKNNQYQATQTIKKISRPQSASIQFQKNQSNFLQQNQKSPVSQTMTHKKQMTQQIYYQQQSTNNNNYQQQFQQVQLQPKYINNNNNNNNLFNLQSNTTPVSTTSNKNINNNFYFINNKNQQFQHQKVAGTQRENEKISQKNEFLLKKQNSNSSIFNNKNGFITNNQTQTSLPGSKNPSRIQSAQIQNKQQQQQFQQIQIQMQKQQQQQQHQQQEFYQNKNPNHNTTNTQMNHSNNNYNKMYQKMISSSKFSKTSNFRNNTGGSSTTKSKQKNIPSTGGSSNKYMTEKQADKLLVELLEGRKSLKFLGNKLKKSHQNLPSKNNITEEDSINHSPPKLQQSVSKKMQQIQQGASSATSMQQLKKHSINNILDANFDRLKKNSIKQQQKMRLSIEQENNNSYQNILQNSENLQSSPSNILQNEELKKASETLRRMTSDQFDNNTDKQTIQAKSLKNMDEMFSPLIKVHTIQNQEIDTYIEGNNENNKKNNNNNTNNSDSYPELDLQIMHQKSEVYNNNKNNNSNLQIISEIAKNKQQQSNDLSPSRKQFKSLTQLQIKGYNNNNNENNISMLQLSKKKLSASYLSHQQLLMNDSNIDNTNNNINLSLNSARKSILKVPEKNTKNIYKKIEEGIKRINRGLNVGQNDMKAQNKNNKPYECKWRKIRSKVNSEHNIHGHFKMHRDLNAQLKSAFSRNNSMHIQNQQYVKYYL